MNLRYCSKPTVKRLFRVVLAIFLPLMLAACSSSSLRKEIVRPEPSYALPPATAGIFADMANDQFAYHGPESSGFKLLDGSYDALKWRLALIDSAVSSLDIQTYLWYPDNSGRLILQRAADAAQRGVKVRLVIDDLLTAGKDQSIYELNNLPNIEFRLFNPWKSRELLSRAGEMITDFERLNIRMHDKLIIVDGNAAIIGGRNLGDHYFGLSSDYNFHDLDVLGIGHIARQSNEMFDHFWNSEWVISAENLNTEHDPEFAEKKAQQLSEQISTAEELKAFGSEPRDWSAELAAVAAELHTGTSYVIYDTTNGDQIEQGAAAKIFGFMDLAQKELLITNAYIIPGQPGIDFIRSLTDRGVTVKILTNSLASHDVPAVNSHYKDWRDDFISAGAELFELRADAAIQSIVDVPPVEGGFVGLHTKAVVVDREMVFIGSMNFDPRSININTEAGAFVTSTSLAEELARVMYRDMDPTNAWQVLLDEKGKPYWINSDETVHKQPARNLSQRIMDIFFKIFPKDQY